MGQQQLSPAGRGQSGEDPHAQDDLLLQQHPAGSLQAVCRDAHFPLFSVIFGSIRSRPIHFPFSVFSVFSYFIFLNFIVRYLCCGHARVCVIHWHCSAQLSMFNMEKRYRNKIIIIIIITFCLFLCSFSVRRHAHVDFQLFSQKSSGIPVYATATVLCFKNFCHLLRLGLLICSPPEPAHPFSFLLSLFLSVSLLCKETE